ncbi:MAG: type VI secretion protein IcmF/TssM N-terminal domain-containing protein, partial [Gammaproteobacteria bacterium]
MKTFFRLLLIIFVWALISAVVLGVNLLVLERPMEDGVRIIVILFLAWLAFLLLRKLYIRYRAKQRVKGLINEEAAEGGGNRGLLARVFGTGYGPGDFRSRFKDIVKVLKNSKLRTKGDPVYVMPWYLVLGGRDTGKSCLVKEARLPGPSLNEPALDSGGESFDWTLHNTGVLVDVPGRFVIDPGQYERQSWKGLFESLLQYRRKEPINGVVVTVSIDRLRGADELALAEEGRKVRERLDEIMGALSINIPVYLVVTKCDQLAGYSDWVKIMPEERLDDAMGVAGNADVATGRMQAATFISSAVEQVAERLKDLMLAVMNKASDSNRMLLLPAELESISSALMQFAGSAFQTNPYQESPMLRGLYFVGRFEHDTEVEEEKLQTLFSRDLFSRLLPADRSMVSTLSSAERAQIFTRRVVMSFWTIFMVILFLGLSAVFYGNYSYLGRTAKNYAGQLEPIGDFSTRVATLADLREVVLDVDQTVSSWWMPWFEVGETPVFVQKLERLYVSRFQNKVLDPVEDALAQRLRG